MDNKLRIQQSLKLEVRSVSDGQVLSVHYPAIINDLKVIENYASLDYLCENGMVPFTFKEDERKGLRYKIGRAIDEFMRRIPFNGERNYSFSVLFYNQSCYLTECYENLFRNGFVDRAIGAKCIKGFIAKECEGERWRCEFGESYSVDYSAPCVERNYPTFGIAGREFDWVEFHEYFEIVEKDFKPIKELHVVRFEDDTTKEVQG